MNRPCSVMVLGVSMAVLLASCGGGGGGGGGDSGGPPPDGGTNAGKVTTFAGGTLADLEALSPTLTFDQLEITGDLTLPSYSNATITANKLTLTSTGRIGYGYTTCEYVDAPSITMNAAGEVVIEGEISLTGRSGTTVTESASCNSCYGQDGGSVTITGNIITVSGKIQNYGGGGASIHWSFGGSSPCSAGGSGNLTLAAKTTMDLGGADIKNSAGKNFEGTRGTSGTATITAGGAFTMKNGDIEATGAMTFTAASTDIWGAITYGSLNESIGGSPDTTKPSVTVLSPQTNTDIPWHQSLDVKVQASDVGMGLRTVQVKGLGYDKTHGLAEFVDSTLTVTISSPDLPETLDVIAADNKGNTTTVSVTGLKLKHPAEVEPNDSIAAAQALELNGIIEGDILTGDSGYVYVSPPTGLNPNVNSNYILEDFYKVTCCTTWVTGSWPNTRTHYGIRINLDFSESAALVPDIDLYLLGDNGSTVLASGIRDNVKDNIYSEYLLADLQQGTAYYVALQAFDVATRVKYKIKSY